METWTAEQYQQYLAEQGFDAFFDGAVPDVMTSEEYRRLVLGEPGKESSPTPPLAVEDGDYVGALVAQLVEAGLPAPGREYAFHAVRGWRIDLYWPAYRFGVEVDGGLYGRPVVCPQCKQPVRRKLKDGRTVVVREGGRHNTGAGFEGDVEKLNEAALAGIVIVRVTPNWMKSGKALDWIRRGLIARGWEPSPR